MTAWPGCHGVRLAPPELAAGFGQTEGEPLLDATLAEAGVDATGSELWSRSDLVAVAAEPGGRRVEQRVLRRDDGAIAVVTPAGNLLADRAASAITIDAPTEAGWFQLVTTYGIPLLLHDLRFLILHAMAAADDGGAVVVCGRSGAGKSSLLVGLVDAGWTAISEDLVVVDCRGGAPVVWPGPPWVRRAHGDPGPLGASPRFVTADKVAWDTASHIATSPVPVRELVFLDAPAGSEPSSAPLTAPAALAALARHALWLEAPATRAAGVFEPAAQFARRAPARRLRFAVSGRWLELAPAVLAGGG